jgi:hypothetical protein
MFQKFYVHQQEDYIVHVALYRAYLSTLQTAYINERITYHIRLHAQYSLPDDEHKLFETCRRQEELN